MAKMQLWLVETAFTGRQLGLCRFNLARYALLLQHNLQAFRSRTEKTTWPITPYPMTAC
jgi:hypothetical protein